ncbi:amidase signature enzyme [Aaosphaeria arxii CBS 175.79]|uniref:Amidase signature enzyme n=1 Tax=Aaosphaeria arxii CBS 175.79 TaxID=1450172 RepID=A0A6A5XQ38_9PLEO|nr:amidase signature enzyme [Aaosphaeria arxii CBS 175.79]KAF2015272.1 amidase signature enzyme [Aaosphaeria arxii CBS 175.79]
MVKVFRKIKSALSPNIEPDLPPAYFESIQAQRKLSYTSSNEQSTTEFDPLVVSAYELSDMLNCGAVTSVEIVQAYLHQIEQHNRRGRQLRALISVAPRHELLRIARKLDDERSRGKRRSPLHGIPIVLKDNIMTDISLGMDTTVGSYAFVGGVPRKNATIVDRLVRRGMIIMGKANLTEFCGLKNPSMPPGWSAVGGQCQSPYVARHIAKRKLHWELSAPGGSSTGSAVSVASGFSTLAVGTDTIGSLITPANRAALYALKPTVGEVPMDGIFCLSKTFDSAGGMAKSAKDLVALMDAMMLPTSKETGTKVPTTCFRIKEDWGNLRIGFTEPVIWKSWKKSGRINADAERFMLQKYEMVVQTLIDMGVDIVYPVELPPQSSLNMEDNKNSFEPIVYSEFKECLSEFIRDFEVTKVHSLAEIINFNLEHPELTLPPSCPNQNDLMAALQSGILRDEVNAARQHLKLAGGREGLDFIFADQQLDIIVAPGDAALSSLAAAAGYPTAACPLSALKLNGQPFGLTLASRAHTEHMLLHFLTAFEATFPPRALPLPLSSVPLQDPCPEPLPDKPIIDLILHEWDTRRFSCSADALADWLNARWRKSGYELSAETICEVLRSNGRIAFRGLGDDSQGAFAR